jgi:hypothetical protein
MQYEKALESLRDALSRIDVLTFFATYRFVSTSPRDETICFEFQSITAYDLVKSAVAAIPEPSTWRLMPGFRGSSVTRDTFWEHVTAKRLAEDISALTDHLVRHLNLHHTPRKPPNLASEMLLKEIACALRSTDTPTEYAAYLAQSPALLFEEPKATSPRDVPVNEGFGFRDVRDELARSSNDFPLLRRFATEYEDVAFEITAVADLGREASVFAAKLAGKRRGALLNLASLAAVAEKHALGMYFAAVR